MTVSMRAYLRGRTGDQPVVSPYGFTETPSWAQSAHSPLGLEDLDDLPGFFMPIGGFQTTKVGAVAQPTSGPVAQPAGTPASSSGNSFADAINRMTTAVGTAAAAAVRPTASSGAVAARTVSADGSVNGDKTFFAELIQPEHPQYQAAQTALRTGNAASTGALAQNIQQGIAQAAQGLPANSWLGSLLGAGIGGPGLGTGPLTGLLQQRALDLFGTAGLPPAAYWEGNRLRPTSYAGDANWVSLANDVDAMGRSTVSRILGATTPQIDGIRRLLEHRAQQVQATSESRALSQMENYQREVMALLQHIALRTGARSPIDFAINQYAANGGQWRRY